MTIRRLHRRLWVDVLQLFWVAGWRRERIAKWEPDPRSSNGGKPNPASYFVRSGGIFAILCRCAMLRSCWRTVWRWMQYYGPELKQRLRQHLKPTNKSWRVDE